MGFHILKTLSEHFNAVREGVKRAQLRRDDRGYFVGDVALVQYEHAGERATGNIVIARVTHIYMGEYLREGWVMLSLGEVMHGFINFEGEHASAA